MMKIRGGGESLCIWGFWALLFIALLFFQSMDLSTNYNTEPIGLRIIDRLQIEKMLNLTPCASEDVKSDTLYISINGNDDSGNGSLEKPYATVNKCLSEGALKIMVSEGVYSQTIDLDYATKNNITIVSSELTERPVFIGPDAFITHDEKAVSGYSRVFYCNYESSSMDPNIRLYQDKVPDTSTLITDEERNPYQRGQKYRCLDTPIISCSSENLEDALMEIETDSDYRYYYDNEKCILYFSRPEKVTVEHPIMRSTGVEFIVNSGREFELKIYGIECKYMKFTTAGSISHIEDCKCSNAFGSGCFVYDTALSTEFVRCEASGAHYKQAGDGFNGHSYAKGDPYSKQTTVRLVDCWSHDCWDDGYSDHERSETEIWGGLFEHNGKAGVTPAYGSHCSCYNVVSRNNYSGFMYCGEATEAEGGQYGQMLCVDCVAENNTDESSGFGFCVSSTGNLVRLINCKAIGNRVGYYCGPDTILEMIDCGALDNSDEKIVSNGTLYVKNTEPIKVD